MKTYTTNDDLAEFLNAVAAQKRVFADWCYARVWYDGPDGGKLPIDEILQFIPFNFQKGMPLVLPLPATNYMLLVVPKDQALGLNKFEKGILENFRAAHVRSEVRMFDPAGLEAFAKYIHPYIGPDRVIERTLLTRLARPGNCMMVMDDDVMMTRQLEKILGGMGMVVSLNKPDNFIEQYAQYAPDILFLDIHLRTAMGNQLLRDLKARIDPYAHIVMISSDTSQKTVLDIKEGGAKGFIVKPFNRNNVFQHLQRAQTVVM